MITFESISNSVSVDETVDLISAMEDKKPSMIVKNETFEVIADHNFSDYAAAQYAFEVLAEAIKTDPSAQTDPLSLEVEYLDAIKGNLDFIASEGAKFDLSKAMIIATTLLENSSLL